MDNSVSRSYIRFLEEINEAISPIDVRDYSSKALHTILTQIYYTHKNFWEKYSSTVFNFKFDTGNPTFLIWGTPHFEESASGIVVWNHEPILKRLLCYAQQVAIPDWVSDVLDHLLPGVPGTYRDIFKNLKQSSQLLLTLKPFIDQGYVTIFPGYELCRQNWGDFYPECEENSHRIFRDHSGEIHHALKDTDTDTDDLHVRDRINVVQEAIFIHKQLGYIPASADPGILTIGSFCFNLSRGPSFLTNWKENYEYATRASLQLISEIRRWGNQAIFLEHLPSLTSKFDLSDRSSDNINRIAKYLMEIKYQRQKNNERRDKLLAGTDLTIGFASIFLAHLGPLSLFHPIWKLARKRKSINIDDVTNDFACLVTL